MIRPPPQQPPVLVGGKNVGLTWANACVCAGEKNARNQARKGRKPAGNGYRILYIMYNRFY